jgi:hypothetical protein
VSDTIAIFPEGNLPLGTSLGTPCSAYNYNTTPPTCITHSNRGKFQFGANEPGGAYNVNVIEVFLATDTRTDPRGPGAGGPYLNAPFCRFLYVPPNGGPTGDLNGIIYLDQVTQVAPGSPYTPNFSPGSAIGSGAPLTNTACTIYPASSSYAQHGVNEAVLTLDIQFAQNGTYYMYETAENRQGVYSAGNSAGRDIWSIWGYWQVGLLN